MTLDVSSPSHEQISSLLVPRPYRVLDKVTEGSDVVTVHLAPVEGALPGFLPAQVSMLGAFGVGEAAISISSSSEETDHHAYTIRRAGAITNALIDTPVGGVITVRGPFGNHWPLHDLDTDQLLIAAGGLGIAPLRSLIHDAVRTTGLDRLAVVYGAKTPADLIYRADLEQWADDGAEVALTVDVGDDEWTDSVGVVPDMLGADGVELDWSNTTAFVCGPDVMMHFTALKLIDLGVPAEQDLADARTQHAVRQRALRPLPARTVHRLPRRSGRQLRRHPAVPPGAGAVR